MAQPRSRSLRAFVWLLAGLGGLLVAVTLVARSPWAARQLARVVAGVLEAQTGERAVISGVVVRLERREIQVDGLVLAHRSDDPMRDGAPIVAVDRMTVGLTLEDWKPAVTTIDVRRPVVRLHVDEDGLREFRNAKRTEEPIETLPWKHLVLREADISVEAPLWGAAVEGVHLRSARTGAARLEVGGARIDAGKVALASGPFTLDGLTVTPQRVVIPRLDLPFDGVAITGAAAVQPGGPIRADLSLAVDLDQIDPATGPRVSIGGHALLDVLVEGTTDAPLVSGAVLSDDFAMKAGREPMRDIDIGPIRAGWRLEGRRLVVERLRLPWDQGALIASGSIDLATTGCYFVVDAEGVSLEELLLRLGVSPHPWVDLELDLEGHIAGTLNPTALAGTLEAAAKDFVVKTGPVRDPASTEILRLPVARLLGQIQIDPDSMRINGQQVATARSRGTVDTRVVFGDDPSLDVLANFTRLRLDELRPLGDLDLEGDGAATLRVWGPNRDLQVAGRITADDFGFVGIPFADRLETSVEVEDLRVLHFPRFDARRGDTDYGGQFSIDLGDPDLPLDLSLLVHRGRIKDMVGMFLDVPAMDAGFEGSLTLQGPWDRMDGEVLMDIGAADLFGEPFEHGEATAWMEQGRFTLQELWLERDDGAESLFARGSVGAGWATDIELVSGGIRLEQLALLGPTGPPLRGRLDLDARILGTLSAPEPHGRLTLRGTSLGPRPVGDSTLYFDSADGRMDFYGLLAGRELDVEGSLGLDGTAEWSVKADLERFPAHLFYPEGADGKPVRAFVSGHLEAGGAFGDDAVPLEVDARADAVDLRWSTHHLTSTGPWTWRVLGGAYALEGVGLVGGDTAVSFGGERGEDGRLELRGGGVVDLDLLRLVVPGVTRAEGRADVELSVVGTRGALEPQVGVAISGGLVEGDWFPQPFEGIEASILATPSGFRIGEARGLLGGGSWDLTGGIDADTWVPTRFDLATTMRDARVQYLDYLPAIVGDAELTFDGPMDALLLAGRIEIRDMQFADRIDWEDDVLAFSGERLTGSAASETDDWFDLNLAIVGDRTIRVRNNLADLTASADLRFIGDTSRPGLIGEVRALPGGRVYLKEREFELVRGELRFIDPYTFDPELDIALLTRVRTRDAEYLVDYRLGGPYSDWRAETSSSPSLPQADINALLLFGMTREELQRYGGAATALALEGGDLLAGKLGLFETIGEGITSIGIADFAQSLRPERIDLVSGASERGSGTISSEFRLIAEKDLEFTQSTIIVEQNLSRTSDTYVGVEKRLADRLFARGYWASQQIGRSLDIGGAWGVEFNVRWELD